MKRRTLTGSEKYGKTTGPRNLSTSHSSITGFQHCGGGPSDNLSGRNSRYAEDCD
jgi:hypothetical protein